MNTKFFLPILFAAGLAGLAHGQAAAGGSAAGSGAASGGAATAPAGSVSGNAQVNGNAARNGNATLNGNANVNGNANANVNNPQGTPITGDPNPGGLHRREEFPNAVIPGELRRDLPPGMTGGGDTNAAGSNTNFFGSTASSNRTTVNSNRFAFNTNQFNNGLTNGGASDGATTPNDQALLAKVRQTVETDLGANAGNTFSFPVRVAVDNGIVQLIGFVPTAQDKQRILLSIQQIPGVVRILDGIQVSPGTTGVNAGAGVTVPNPAVPNLTPTSRSNLAPTRMNPNQMPQ